MKHILFADRNLDAFVAAILTFYKSLYNGVSEVVVAPFSITDDFTNFKYGDTVILIATGVSPMTIDRLVYDIGVNTVVIEHHKRFADEIGYTFVDWHNLNYFFLMETSEFDIFDKLDTRRETNKVGWRFYYNNNAFENKLNESKRSSLGIIRDVLKDKDPFFFNFLKTFVGEDVERLIELSQEHELFLHEGNEKSDAYLLGQWFKCWYEENEQHFEHLREKPNLQDFLILKSAFTMVSVEDKIKMGKDKLYETKYKTKEIAFSDCVKKIRFRHYDVTEMKACYIDSTDVAAMGGNIVGTELVKEHGWDVVVLNGPVQKDTHIYFLFSNPDGADIDVSEICKLYCDEGTALNKTGRRNLAGIEFLKGEEEMFFEFI